MNGAYVVVVVVCGSLALCLCVPVSVSLFRCIPCVSSCVSKLIYLLYLSHWYRLSVVCPVWTFSSYRSYLTFYVRIPFDPHPPAAFSLISSPFFSASPPTSPFSPSYVPQIDPDTLPGVGLNGACFRYPICQTVRTCKATAAASRTPSLHAPLRP